VKVVELMNKNVVTCHATEKLNVILNKFELFRLQACPFTDKGKLVGIIAKAIF